MRLTLVIISLVIGLGANLSAFTPVCADFTHEMEDTNKEDFGDHCCEGMIHACGCHVTTFFHFLSQECQNDRFSKKVERSFFEQSKDLSKNLFRQIFRPPIAIS